VSEILRSLARATSLGLYHAEEIGTHYARFIRMWDYYLAYCEGAFLERHIGDFQLRRTKNHSSATLFSEPWREDRGPLDSAAIQEPVHLGAGQ
jgi:cyclopropane-fatty-acyl-phospholipid synthase